MPWDKGLKTGSYYIRTKAATTAIKGLGIDLSRNQDIPKSEDDNYSDLSCSIDNPEDCEACGS